MNSDNSNLDLLKFIIAIIAALISLSSAFISWYYARRTVENTKLSQFLQFSGLKRQYFSQLQGWAKEVVETISDAISLCYLDPQQLPEKQFFYKRHELYSKLSSLLDEGRWFFPNLQSVKEQNKEEAFKGIRQDVLNAIAETIHFVTQINYVEQSNNKEIGKEYIVKSKRLFVTEIQKVLNPAERDEEFERLTSITKNKFLS